MLPDLVRSKIYVYKIYIQMLYTNYVVYAAPFSLYVPDQTSGRKCPEPTSKAGSEGGFSGFTGFAH